MPPATERNLDYFYLDKIQENRVVYKKTLSCKDARGRILQRVTRVYLDFPGWSLHESLDFPPLFESFDSLRESNWILTD